MKMYYSSIQGNIRFILATLEEREREEFAKLKKVKKKMESGNNGKEELKN